MPQTAVVVVNTQPTTVDVWPRQPPAPPNVWGEPTSATVERNEIAAKDGSSLIIITHRFAQKLSQRVDQLEADPTRGSQPSQPDQPKHTAMTGHKGVTLTMCILRIA